MLRLINCEICHNDDFNLEANTGDYYYCPKCVSLPNDIHVCKSCFAAGHSTCPKCGTELAYHDGQENRAFQQSGGRF